MNPSELLNKIRANVEKVIKGQSATVKKIIAAFVGGGHVLLEDYPGTGKTTLAKVLARSMDIKFRRIQFTPDLLPTDIIGVSIFNPESRAFLFHEGPIFTQILLADEINRASPRTQSALLESMAESQVSVDGKIRPLKEPFFVIATQNPVETSGTYPLPEAQMDRFAVRLSLGYIPLEDEMAVLLDQQDVHPLEGIRPCAGRDEILGLRKAASRVPVSPDLRQYMVRIVRETRHTEEVSMGASPRASLALMKTAQALALYDEDPFVTPEHIQDLAVCVIAHRLILDPAARFSGTTPEAVVADILHRVPAPV